MSRSSEHLRIDSNSFTPNIHLVGVTGVKWDETWSWASGGMLLSGEREAQRIDNDGGLGR